MAELMSWNPVAGPVADVQPESPVAPKIHPSIERREKLSSDDFFSEYVAKGRPVVVTGALNRCPALARWTFDHLRRVSGQRFVKLKQGVAEEGVAGLRTVDARLSDYLDQLEVYESRLESDEMAAKDRPPHFHDVPLLSLLPDAANDLRGFPSDYFPGWYRPYWLQFAQFFLGPKHSLTPLHFDCLLTHNLFFQVAGRKRFILLDHDQLPYCYRYRWRWCEADPENPNFERHPLFREALVRECTVVEPGDLLYMPPGMLHHVRSLDCESPPWDSPLRGPLGSDPNPFPMDLCAISFNVDWHTRDSSVQGILALGRGMPLKNVYYNTVIARGLCAGISAERLLPWYRSYLNYVS
ncbi:cupin-like domain-containing protein [Methylocaldum sp. MU1018]